jgi:hypothetical protein
VKADIKALFPNGSFVRIFKNNFIVLQHHIQIVVQGEQKKGGKFHDNKEGYMENSIFIIYRTCFSAACYSDMHICRNYISIFAYLLHASHLLVV